MWSEGRREGPAACEAIAGETGDDRDGAAAAG